MVEALGREEAADRRHQQLQTALSQLEARLTHTRHFLIFMNYFSRLACFVYGYLDMGIPHHFYIIKNAVCIHTVLHSHTTSYQNNEDKVLIR